MIVLPSVAVLLFSNAICCFLCRFSPRRRAFGGPPCDRGRRQGQYGRQAAATSAVAIGPAAPLTAHTLWNGWTHTTWARCPPSRSASRALVAKLRPVLRARRGPARPQRMGGRQADRSPACSSPSPPRPTQPATGPQERGQEALDEALVHPERPWAFDQGEFACCECPCTCTTYILSSIRCPA